MTRPGGALPLDVQPYHQAIRRYRAAVVRAALVRSGGNRTHAARALGLQRTYLCRLIRELGQARKATAS